MIKIKTERVLKGRKEMRRIKEVEALAWDELPLEYLEGSPCCYLRSNSMGRRLEGSFGYLSEGSLLEESAFQATLKTIRACGERLASIPKRPWAGEETFII